MRTLGLVVCLGILFASPRDAAPSPIPHPGSTAATLRNAHDLVLAGQRTFRFDTFGDETFWSGVLGLNEAIAGAANGGVGPGLSPRAALGAGLKVDLDALSRASRRAVAAGTVDLDDPAVTTSLITADAVVGVRGTADAQGRLASVGITCALCHSTVDDAAGPGIGHRLDGWANRDLDVGAVISLAPNLAPVAASLGVDEATLRAVLAGWGPGKFDAEVFLDGKGFRPDGTSGATLIPPAFGLAGVNLHTYTGWGSIPYWNAFVATLEMHGQGRFVDARLADAAKFPIAAAHGDDDVQPAVDRVTPTLAGLQLYQLSLPVPTPAAASLDTAAVARGRALFEGRARCATCHVPPLYTESGWNMHTAAEIGIDDFQASRAPDDRYRTTPLRGMASHAKGGFYHDGRFADLGAVVRHYDQHFGLGLSDAEVADLVAFLGSL